MTLQEPTLRRKDDIGVGYADSSETATRYRWTIGALLFLATTIN